ncbi:hypothetical protein J6590_028335 [Homalodisca vitripennis]|nr:hypothetical protein J6590_028335 [Homalodisca vitripennis]
MEAVGSCRAPGYFLRSWALALCNSNPGGAMHLRKNLTPPRPCAEWLKNFLAGVSKTLLRLYAISLECSYMSFSVTSFYNRDKRASRVSEACFELMREIQSGGVRDLHVKVSSCLKLLSRKLKRRKCTTHKCARRHCAGAGSWGYNRAGNEHLINDATLLLSHIPHG